MTLPRMAFVVAALMVSGCADYVSWRKREGLDYFVGRPQSALVAALGSPQRQWREANTGFLAYDYAANLWVAGEPGVRTPDSEVPYGPWVNHVECTTTFKVQADVVAAWRLDGSGCRGAPFPPLRQFAASREALSQGEDVRHVTQFGDDGFTGRSAVEYGKFYSQ